MAEIQSLNQRHYRMLDLFLAGKTTKEVAEIVKVTPQQASVVYNSPNFQHELSLRQAALQQKIDRSLASQAVDHHNSEAERVLRETTIAAAQRLQKLVDCENLAISRMAANDILDRTGFPKVTRQDQQRLNAVVVLNQRDVDRIVETVELEDDSVEDKITDAIIEGENS